MVKQTYYVNWRYQSNLGGPWAAGDEVELDADTAQAIDNDSPGVLTLQGRTKVPPDAAPADRQVKTAQKRVSEPIDKTTYKAVKDKG